MKVVQVVFVLAILFHPSIESRVRRQVSLNENENSGTINESIGNCMNIFACKSIFDFIKEQDNFNKQIKEALRNYACGTDDKGIVKVLCPNKLPPELLQLEEAADDSTHPNYKLLSSNCGVVMVGEKITNGNEASLFEFPWAAALKYDKKTNPYICGGSLINDRYILTAAHCILSRRYNLIGVRLGEHNFNTDPDCIKIGDVEECAESPQDFKVDINDTIVHPKYDNASQHNDIALIRLRRPANTTVYSVSPICLPLTPPVKTKIFTNYTVIGWGATESGYPSPVLRRVYIPRVETAECAPKYRPGGRELTSNQICAGVVNKQDSCVGDSGGPLSADYSFTDGPKVVQYGIVSFGPKPCGTNGFPGVYTNVSRYTKWILDNLRP